MNEHQELAVEALRNLKNGDTARVRYAWANASPAYMAATYGASGKSRAQILAEYDAHDAKVDAAIEWVLSK